MRINPWPEPCDYCSLEEYCLNLNEARLHVVCWLRYRTCQGEGRPEAQ